MQEEQGAGHFGSGFIGFADASGAHAHGDSTRSTSHQHDGRLWYSELFADGIEVAEAVFRAKVGVPDAAEDSSAGGGSGFVGVSDAAAGQQEQGECDEVQ